MMKQGFKDKKNLDVLAKEIADVFEKQLKKNYWGVTNKSESIEVVDKLISFSLMDKISDNKDELKHLWENKKEDIVNYLSDDYSVLDIYGELHESIRDEMTPKSENEIEEEYDELWDELVELGLYESYSTKELVEEFFEPKWEEIKRMVEDGFSNTEEIYDEYKNELIRFIEDSEEEYDDSDDRYEEWRYRNN